MASHSAVGSAPVLARLSAPPPKSNPLGRVIPDDCRMNQLFGVRDIFGTNPLAVYHQHGSQRENAEP